MQRITVSPDARLSTSDELELTRQAVIHYNPDSHSCHRCGKRIWASRKTATYRRGITYIRDGHRVDEELLIPLCLCRKCGKSERRGGNPDGDYCHAILPDTLIPFTYFSLLFVLTVLRDYADRFELEASRRTVADICSFWDISVSTLYRWKKRYWMHYEAWAGSLDRIAGLKAGSQSPDPAKAEAGAIGSSLCLVFHAFQKLLPDFFSRFRFSFLQPNHLTHFRPPSSRRRL